MVSVPQAKSLQLIKAMAGIQVIKQLTTAKAPELYEKAAAAIKTVVSNENISLNQASEIYFAIYTIFYRANRCGEG